MGQLIQHTTAFALTRTHARRLRAYYRSAGWPFRDNIEIDLLGAGLIERVAADTAPLLDCIRLTEAGLQALNVSLQRNRGAFDVHEQLVEHVAQAQAASGRLVYRGVTLRGEIADSWKPCRPDVYSIRHTSVAAYVHPIIHEIKVRRADLLSDLKHADKRAAYQALSSEFYYVMPQGLAQLHEIPTDCGVLYVESAGIRLGRASPKRQVELSFHVWMSLARRGAELIELDEAQGWLGAPEA